MRAHINHPALFGQTVVLPLDQKLRIQINAHREFQQRFNDFGRDNFFPILKVLRTVFGKGVLRRVVEGERGEIQRRNNNDSSNSRNFSFAEWQAD